jgi:hypothetical protein
VHGWGYAPQAHSRASNINFDILIFGGRGLYISNEKLSKDRKVLSYLGFNSKVLSGF